MDPLYRSTEIGPDGNPLVFALESGALRHLGGFELALRVKGGDRIVDVTAAELAPLPRAGGPRRVSGTLTLD